MATVEKPKNPDVVKLSEINKIIEEEGLAVPQVLSEELTIGQVRGIAGRRRTQVLKRLGELGIVPSGGEENPQRSKLTVIIECTIILSPEVVILRCRIILTLGNAALSS